MLAMALAGPKAPIGWVPAAVRSVPHVASECPVVCASCGTENEAGRKFCKECAAQLELVCPSCGAANSADAKFCGECAAPLVAGATPSPAAMRRSEVPALAPAPVAERRHVSVLFADLVGFTPFAEERDAEEVRDTLARYFEIAGEVIARHGGTVEKFIGDAVMAVWGAPVAHEDDAERVVRAGLELGDAVRKLGPSMQVRVGILTGEAAVSVGATGQGMVAGDLVNTASRLQSVAPPGTVLVGEATARAASAAIVFEPAGEQALKGKTAPVPAWRALRVVAERGGRNRAETLEAPFVGRADELRLLKDLFHATLRERRPRHVSVTGQAGIGKTRLAWEFLKYVDGLADAVFWHEGRCPPYGDGITFWALGEMVRARAGLLETDDEATTRRKLAETLAAHVPDAEERRWIEPALLALLGIGTGSAGPEQLFAAWRTFFERLAKAAPVVMVFEDLQHADSGLLDFIDHLLEWSRGAPIYVLTLARPELLERRPGWGAGRRVSTWSRCRSPPCASSSAASSPVSRRRWSGRLSSGPAGFRCTRSRRSGCSSPTAGSWRATGRTGRPATWRRSPCRRRSPSSSPPGSTPSTLPTGPSCSTPPSSARASRRRPSRR
jgi:class 3 adenylate cyclase